MLTAHELLDASPQVLQERLKAREPLPLDEEGNTLLHLFALLGDVETLEAIFDSGKISIDARNSAQRTPLMFAIRSNSVSSVEFVLSKGANVNISDSEGDTPLHIAATIANPIILKTLIARGAAVNARNSSGETSVSRAAIFADPKTLQVLAEANADLNEANDEGHTPLMMASSAGNLRAVEILIELDADVTRVDHAGNNALHWCALKTNNVAVARALAAHRELLVVRNSEEKTAADIARDYGHGDVARALSS